MRVAATVVLALLGPLTSAAALSARLARRAEPGAAGHTLAADGVSHVDGTPPHQLVSGTAANHLSDSGVAEAEIDSAATAAAAGHATQGHATQSIDEQKCSPEVLKACQENSGQVEPLGCILCLGHIDETSAADPNGVSLVDHKGRAGVGLARAAVRGPKKTGPKKTGPKKKDDKKKHDKKKGEFDDRWLEEDEHRLRKDEHKVEKDAYRVEKDAHRGSRGRGGRGPTRNGSVRHGGSTRGGRGGRGGSVGRQRGGRNNDNHHKNGWEHGFEDGFDDGWKDGRKHDRHSSGPVRHSSRPVRKTQQQQQRQRLSSRDIQADAGRRTSVMDVLKKGGLKKGGLKKGGIKKAGPKKVGRDVDKRDNHEVSQVAGQAEASKRPAIKKVGINGLKKAVKEKLQGKKAARLG